MGEIKQLTTTALVVVGLVVSLGIFYTAFAAQNITNSNSYAVLSNSATSAATLNATLADMVDAAKDLQAEDAGFLQIGLAIVKGTLAFLKLPFLIADLLNSIIDDALFLIGVPYDIIPLVKLAVLIWVAFGIISYVGKKNP